MSKPDSIYVIYRDYSATSFHKNLMRAYDQLLFLTKYIETEKLVSYSQLTRKMKADGEYRVAVMPSGNYQILKRPLS